MGSLTGNVDLGAMTKCCVVHVHRLRNVARPGDRATCGEGHHLVVDAECVWTREAK